MHNLCTNTMLYSNKHPVICRKDTFSIQCSDLGELTNVKVRHDNSGSGPSWLLDSVEVRGEETRERNGTFDEGQRVWHFPCGQWLEVCEGCGGKLEVKLEVGGQHEARSTSDKEKGTCRNNSTGLCKK